MRRLFSATISRVASDGLIRICCLFLLLQRADSLRNSVTDVTTESSNVECQLPSEWQGDWYEYDDNTAKTSVITINATDFDAKGNCQELEPTGERKNEKVYRLLLLSKDEYAVDCWLCMFVFERHRNILQYRTSKSCVTAKNDACNHVDINMHMLSIFRVHAKVEQCPIAGPANFSYSTIHDGRCDTKTSTIGVCVDEFRFRLNYVACPEVQMQSHTDDLICIGQFEAFNKRFFVAKIIGQTAPNLDGDLYRCFMYETNSAGGILKITSDASCRSLEIGQAALEVNYVMDGQLPKASCSFHGWQRHKSGDKDDEIVWQSLTNDGHRHVFDRHEWTIDADDTADGRLSGLSSRKSKRLCIEYKGSSREVSADGGRIIRFVVYSVDDCEQGYRCVEFHHHPKRTGNQVMEVISGRLSPNAYEACGPTNFDKHTQQYETLLQEGSKEQPCPVEHQGQYSVRGCDEKNVALYFGCSRERHSLVFYENCNANKDVYHCYGDWIDPENPFVHYLAVENQSNKKKTCFAYVKGGHNNELRLSTFHQHKCQRGILPGVTRHPTYNLTKIGACNGMQSDASAPFSNAIVVNPGYGNKAISWTSSSWLASLAFVVLTLLLWQELR